MWEDLPGTLHRNPFGTGSKGMPGLMDSHGGACCRP